MFLELLRKNDLFAPITEFDGNTLLGRAQKLRGILKDIDPSAAIAQAEEHICPELRTFGRHSKFFWPLGYFHPTQAQDVIIDNVRRGRLSTKFRKPEHIFDFDAQNRLVKIFQVIDPTTVLCESDGNDACYICIKEVDGAPEISWTYLARYEDGGALRQLVSNSWDFHFQNTLWYSIEDYGELKNGSRLCRFYDISFEDEKRISYSDIDRTTRVFHFSYDLLCDEHGRVCDILSYNGQDVEEYPDVKWCREQRP